MKHRARDIFVWMEQGADGMPCMHALSLLTAGRNMSENTGGLLTAVCAADASSEHVHEAAAYGADRVIAMERLPVLSHFREEYAKALLALVVMYRPYAVLFPSTEEGRAIAAYLAAKQEAAVMTEAERVRVLKKNKQAVWKRSSFGGYLICEVTGRTDTLLVGVVLQGAYGMPVREVPHAEIITESGFKDSGLSLMRHQPRMVKSCKKPVADLGSADIIVAGGRGAGGPEGFALIRKLSDVLGGTYAASRVAVDNGWVPKSRLIGQSGKTVRPKLYIGCGISGSVQHITGMRDAGCIVAINSDPKALIFNLADYCIVGDLFEVLPSLIRKVKERKRLVL